MAGRYGRRHIKDEDFEEGEIWNIMEEKQKPPNNKKKQPFNQFPTNNNTNNNNNNSRHHFPTTPKIKIPSSTNETTPHQQFSAPVDIPDWSKIYGKKNKHSITPSSSSWVNNVDNHDYYANDNDNDDDDDDDGVVPPHEYIARKLARTQISSFSVYEGIGRTLKGRDLSKLRNAILTKTGFLE